MNQNHTTAYYISVCAGLMLLTAGLFLLDLVLGSVHIPLPEVWSILTNQTAERESWRLIVLEFRIPKALTAILAGAGLSLSGLMMQTLFRNPLAGPFVLGISSGASLGVALLVLAGSMLPASLAATGNWALVLAATGGSAIVLLVVLAISFRTSDSVSLLIIGLMIGSATGAVVSILQYFGAAEQVQSYLIWTFGSLGGVQWHHLRVLSVPVLAGLILGLLLQKPLNALLLGEHYAATMGVQIGRVRVLIIVGTSLLAGSITAFCGPIAFIGLAVPHLARSALNTSDHRWLIPAVMLAGAALLLTCDIIAQLPGQEITLPLNAITALFGAPVVIWVILRNRNLKSTF